eukprot:2463461-Lingulodinium_polyedra.AAC.1
MEAKQSGAKGSGDKDADESGEEESDLEAVYEAVVEGLRAFDGVVEKGENFFTRLRHTDEWTPLDEPTKG